MNKIVMSFLLLLSCSMLVSAYPSSNARILIPGEHLLSGSCSWIRPATEFRPERTFIGVWGRFIYVASASDSKVFVTNKTLYIPYQDCFSPGSNHHKVDAAVESVVSSEPICETSEVEVCDDIEVCHEHCSWKKVCTHWTWHCGHKKCSHWNWEKECHQDCHNEESCHTETISSCTS